MCVYKEYKHSFKFQLTWPEEVVVVFIGRILKQNQYADTTAVGHVCSPGSVGQ